MTHQCITSSSRIHRGVVWKNGDRVFTGSCSDAPSFLRSAYEHFNFGYARWYKMDSLCKLGWLAAELLLTGNETIRAAAPESTGIILANSNSSLDTDLKYAASMKEMSSPALFVYTLPNIVIGEIGIRHQIKGESAFFVAADWDSEQMEKYISGLFRSEVLTACICGWVDWLNDEYSALLFLVEKCATGSHLPFNAAVMDGLFKQSPNDASK